MPGSSGVGALDPGTQTAASVVDSALINVGAVEPIPAVAMRTGAAGEAARGVDTLDHGVLGAGGVGQGTLINILNIRRLRSLSMSSQVIRPDYKQETPHQKSNPPRRCKCKEWRWKGCPHTVHDRTAPGMSRWSRSWICLDNGLQSIPGHMYRCSSQAD